MRKGRVILVKFVLAFEGVAKLFQLLSEMTTSVTLLYEEGMLLRDNSTRMIHSGMVKDVGVEAPAVVSTIHHGFARSSPGQLLMILKCGFVKIVHQIVMTALLKS